MQHGCGKLECVTSCLSLSLPLTDSAAAQSANNVQRPHAHPFTSQRSGQTYVFVWLMASRLTFMASSSGELPMPTMMMDMGSEEAETMVSTVSCSTGDEESSKRQ